MVFLEERFQPVLKIYEIAYFFFNFM